MFCKCFILHVTTVLAWRSKQYLVECRLYENAFCNLFCGIIVILHLDQFVRLFNDYFLFLPFHSANKVA